METTTTQKGVIPTTDQNGQQSKRFSTTDREKQIQERWNLLKSEGKFEIEKASLALAAKSKGWVDGIKPTSIQEALNLETPSLATIKKYMGNSVMESILRKMIYDVSDFYNIGNGLTDRAIEIISELIFEDFYHLSIADIKLCFRLARKGKFGQTYNRLDGEIIIGWFNQYFSMRCVETARDSQKKHKEEKEIEGKEMPIAFKRFANAYQKRYPVNEREVKPAKQIEALTFTKKQMENYKDKWMEETNETSPFEDWFFTQIGGLPYKVT